MIDKDISQEIQRVVKDASENKLLLNIVGAGSKSFLGGSVDGYQLSTSEHQGIINYEPKELVLTVRSGTPVTEIESLLAAEDQRLTFEPPVFNSQATIGGTVAADMNGPIRPWSGSVKDAMLGTTMINGNGDVLRFGGEVMKNVAGYDISRLMVGSMGTLGVMLDISLRVTPKEKNEITLVFEKDEVSAIRYCHELNAKCLPISGMTFFDGKLYVRLSGNESGVKSARSKIGGELLNTESFWESIKEHEHPFFQQDKPLWRISVPPASPCITEIPGDYLYEWGGAVRWIFGDFEADNIRQIANKFNGHATAYQGFTSNVETFDQLTKTQMKLHRMIKKAFDPKAILNQGRLYEAI